MVEWWWCKVRRGCTRVAPWGGAAKGWGEGRTPKQGLARARTLSRNNGTKIYLWALTYRFWPKETTPQHFSISIVFFNQQGRLNKAGVRLQASPRACCSSTASRPGKEFSSIYEGSLIIQHQRVSNIYCYIFIRDWMRRIGSLWGAFLRKSNCLIAYFILSATDLLFLIDLEINIFQKSDNQDLLFDMMTWLFHKCL